MESFLKTQIQCFITMFTLYILATSVANAKTFSIATREFAHVSLIETELKRGVSTKEDVRRILGDPSGFGGAILPTSVKANNIWFYEDMATTGIASAQGGFMEMRMRMQYLLIFFDNDTFDGFMWWTNVEEAHGGIEN